MSEQYGNHDSVEATAAASETSADFQVQQIEYIRNDGTVNLIVNFDRSTTARGAITIKPSEVFGPFPRKCKKLWYKCASATCAFRAAGVA